MNDQELRRELLIALDYCYKEDDWTPPIADVLLGLSATKAATRLATWPRSAWEIVLHIATWNENIVERIRTISKVGSPDGDWPAVPSDTTEEEWVKAKQRLTDSYELIRSALESTPIEQIQACPYRLADLLCRFTHSGYHIGQLTLMQSLLED